MSLVGIMVLKVGLHSINGSLMWVLVIQVFRDEYRAREMVSAVDLLWCTVNCSGSGLSGRLELMWPLTSLLKHFMMVDVRATGLESLRHVN